MFDERRAESALVESPSKFVPDLLVADVGGYCIYVD
jgi:hypothetical protein